MIYTYVHYFSKIYLMSKYATNFLSLFIIILIYNYYNYL